MTPEDLAFVRSLQPKGFVHGSQQRRMVDLLCRLAAKYEERAFVAAVLDYAEVSK